jgi:DNA-binding Lrp family transcriptional regulator
MPLDRIDSIILAELQKNARLSNKELAARVDLAPSSCHERVRRMTERGVLRGAHAEVSRAALGIAIEAMIGVILSDHSRAVIDRITNALYELPEVVAIYHVAGSTDFLIHVAVRDPQHLRDFALDAVTSRPDVARVETSLIFDYVRCPTLPDYAADD